MLETVGNTAGFWSSKMDAVNGYILKSFFLFFLSKSFLLPKLVELTGPEATVNKALNKK